MVDQLQQVSNISAVCVLFTFHDSRHLNKYGGTTTYSGMFTLHFHVNAYVIWQVVSEVYLGLCHREVKSNFATK